MVCFSGSGRLGRMVWPMSRWMNRKNVPTPTNTRINRTSAGMGLSLRRRRRGRRSSVSRDRRQLLPAHETGVQLMPVPDLGLAEPPAQVDFATVDTATEVDQAGEVVLQLHVQLLQLFLVMAHLFLGRLNLRTAGAELHRHVRVGALLQS